VIGDLRIRELLVLASVLAAGLAGTAVAITGRGADAQFIQDQRHPPALRPADVERVVRTAPDPAVGKGAGIAAICTPHGSGPLRSPWTCVVSYKSGRKARLAVQIRNDGTYLGRYAGGGAAQGCCIDLPGSQ
jgi:hypothetical protein